MLTLRKGVVGVVAVLLVSGMLAAGCGGSESGNPTAPTPAPSTTQASLGVTTSGLFTFSFSAGMSLAQQDLIRSTILSGNTFFQTSMGRTIQQPTTILATSTKPLCVVETQAPGFTGGAVNGLPAEITICVGNMSWLSLTSLHKQKFIIHELFHLVQFEMNWREEGVFDGPLGPYWIVEGAAEYVGWRGVESMGLVTRDTARGCNARMASEVGAPADASLDTLEDEEGFHGVHWGFEFGMLGIDQLLLSRDFPALATYGRLQQGMPWRTAFESAFGISTTAFYAEFPSYRAGLSSLASSQGNCSEDGRG